MFKANKKHVKMTSLDVIRVSRCSNSNVSNDCFEQVNTRCNKVFVSY